eukprot:TRINITY_DN6957_c0_g1_i1.p2 TRINITY_DN6957_c0_g1~~TRINITY_DN6957_c0_g1_i1.p2  ORF type:complete len:162 (-),score=52.43 TRINITY_DN6957_c0_g1_i1:389-874(-)
MPKTLLKIAMEKNSMDLKSMSNGQKEVVDSMVEIEEETETTNATSVESVDISLENADKEEEAVEEAEVQEEEDIVQDDEDQEADLDQEAEKDEEDLEADLVLEAQEEEDLAPEVQREQEDLGPDLQQEVEAGKKPKNEKPKHNPSSSRLRANNRHKNDFGR